MGIATYSKFEYFKDQIFSLTFPLAEEDIVSETFLLEASEDKKLSIFYAPVEYFNPKAIVLVVGITPGINQMKKAFQSILSQKKRLKNNERLLHEAKKANWGCRSI